MKKLGLLLFLLSINCHAETWLTTSLYTKHYDNEWAWNDNQNLYGIEYSYKNLFIGASRFENSFHNKSTAILTGYDLNFNWLGFRAAIGAASGYEKKYCQQYEGGEWYEYNSEVQLINGELVAFNSRCKKTKGMYGKYKGLGMVSAYIKYKRLRLEASLLGKEAYLLTASLKVF